MPATTPIRTVDSSESELLDREQEVAELRAALGAALQGEGRIVLVAGEPGIGKTRLARTVADEAATLGVPVWWGRGWEDGSAPAFWPWNAALRRWIDRAGDESIRAAAAGRSAELTHVFPVLRGIVPDAVPGEPSDADQTRFRVFDGVSRFLAAAAAPAGLVIVLDDIHWADRSSLKLLEFVATDLQSTRLLIVATYRDTEVDGEDAFFLTLSRLAREPSTLRLRVTGLSPTHCAQWMLPLARPDTDVAVLGEALYRETNGNPFFLGEIASLLASEGGLDSDWEARRVPHGVREVVSRRLDRLGPECRAALIVASLLGDVIDAATLRDVLGQPESADHLQRAAHDRILVEVEDRPGEYTFAHALIRRVLMGELQPSAKAAWHARIATVLEQRGSDADDATTELVRHFAAADNREALRKAFDYACRGAEQAARGLGWEEAVRLYEIALDVGGRCGALDSEQALELRLALARALRGSGDVEAARARCEEVVTACRRTPRTVLLAKAALLHAGSMPEHGRIDPNERALLEEACRGADDLDDGLRARLMARLAGDLIAANEVEQADRIVDLCDEATRAARRAGDDGALAMALFGRYYAAALRMRPREKRAGREPLPHPQQILDAAEAGGMHDFVAIVRHIRAMGLLAIGDADGFTAEVDGLATAAAASHAPEALWMADALAALRATLQGRFTEALGWMERAAATGWRMQLPNAIGVHISQRVMWHAIQGRIAEIMAEIDAFVEGHPGGLGWEPMRALARLAGGDDAAARAEFHALLATGGDAADSGLMSRTYLASLCLLCVELRDREQAPALYERIGRRRESWIVDGFHTLGPWPLVRGELARLCGHRQAAVRHFEEALALAQKMGALPFVAEARALLADVELSTAPAAEGHDRIVALLDEAELGARELGLTHVSAHVDRLRPKVANIGEGINAFRCDGDFWTVRYREQEIRLKDGKGPRYLAMLLATPQQELHVLHLAAGAPVANEAKSVPEGLSVGSLGTALDDAPDARARQEYRQRLDDLKAELEEAESFSDLGRVENLRIEIEELTSQLAQRFGSRARVAGPAETARKAVTKVLRTQIGKLLEAHPALGQHLRDSVRMGTTCVYAPATPTSWEVTFASS